MNFHIDVNIKLYLALCYPCISGYSTLMTFYITIIIIHKNKEDIPFRKFSTLAEIIFSVSVNTRNFLIFYLQTIIVLRGKKKLVSKTIAVQVTVPLDLSCTYSCVCTCGRMLNHTIIFTKRDRPRSHVERIKVKVVKLL